MSKWKGDEVDVIIGMGNGHNFRHFWKEKQREKKTTKYRNLRCIAKQTSSPSEAKWSLFLPFLSSFWVVSIYFIPVSFFFHFTFTFHCFWSTFVWFGLFVCFFWGGADCFFWFTLFCVELVTSVWLKVDVNGRGLDGISSCPHIPE